MAYDPIGDAAAFRAALKKLVEIERLTSQGIIDLFTRQRTRGDGLSISRATLDRFIQGEDITKIRELRVIHDLLRGHAIYGVYFEAASSMVNPRPGLSGGEAEPDSLATMFGAFLIPAGADEARREDMLTSLPGQFVLMRRDHDPITVDHGVRVSSLSLSAAADGVAIQETQSYRTPDYEMPFEQTDEGYLFAHGRHVYFLMKEIGGSAVKFGVIEQTLPEIERRQPVQYFQGHMMVVSRRGVFPRTRFAARRYSPNQHPVTSGIVGLAEIADSRAIEHLRLDYAEGGAARPA